MITLEQQDVLHKIEPLLRQANPARASGGIWVV